METSCHISSVLREFETADDMSIKSHLEKIEQQQKECIHYYKLALKKMDFFNNYVITNPPQPHQSVHALDSIPATPIVTETFSVDEVDTPSPLPKDQPATSQPLAKTNYLKQKQKRLHQATLPPNSPAVFSSQKSYRIEMSEGSEESCPLIQKG